MKNLILAMGIGTKIKSWIVALLVSIASIIAPIKPLLLTVGFLIMADFIFGLVRAWKCNEKITSRKMGNTIGKMVLYNIAIISLYALQKYMIDDAMPICKIGACVLAITEILSIDESFKKIYGFSLWTKIKSFVKRGDSNTKDFIK